jgi:hypothetical protein
MALDFMVAHGFPTLVPWVIQDMLRQQRRMSGIEMGFLMSISEYAIAGKRFARGTL